MLSKPHRLASKTLQAGITCTCHSLVIHVFSKEIMPHQIGRFRNRQACRSCYPQSAHSCWHVWIPAGIEPSRLWIPVVICDAGSFPITSGFVKLRRYYCAHDSTLAGLLLEHLSFFGDISAIETLQCSSTGVKVLATRVLIVSGHTTFPQN